MGNTKSTATAAGRQGEAPAAVAAPRMSGVDILGELELLHGPKCLTQEQREYLIAGIKTTRVSQLRKVGSPSYIEAYDVRAHLTRIFGFANWSEDILEVAQTFQASEQRWKKDKKTDEPIPDSEYTAWTVGYRATVRLTICCPHGVPIASYTEVAADVSDAQPQLGEAHHNALSAAASTALKRAAANLGDQFGLSLYRRGSTAALVATTLVHPWDGEKRIGKLGARPDEHIDEQLPREQEPRESVSVPYEGDDYPTAAQATEDDPNFPPAEDGAPRGPEQIKADAIAAKDLGSKDRMQRLTDLMTELTEIGGDPPTRALLIGELASARQAVDRADRAEAHAAGK